MSTNRLRLSTRAGHEDAPEVLAALRAADEQARKDAKALELLKTRRAWRRAYYAHPDRKARYDAHAAAQRAKPENKAAKSAKDKLRYSSDPEYRAKILAASAAYYRKPGVREAKIAKVKENRLVSKQTG